MTTALTPHKTYTQRNTLPWKLNRSARMGSAVNFAMGKLLR
ncbi:hypothetical protein ACVWZI_002664 [Thermostichus sp. OS-CIW-28]|jgi:hypothetical protein